jgi:magnesium transporter
MARESLVSSSRVLLFLTADTPEKADSKDSRAELRTMLRDVRSVLDHITLLSDKITFILDAALGMVTLEQNDIVQAFSVVSVVLMPPTLIASAYGMNFHNMPELNWTYGYPLALLAMLLSSVLPFLFFRWKRWL